MQLPEALVAELDLADVSKDAARRGADFFPSRIAYRAAQQSDAYRTSLAKKLRSGYVATPAEIVQVPKLGGTTRPAADMAVGDRLLLDALNRFLRDRTVEGVVNWSLAGDERVEAEEGLITGTNTHVLVTDVVGFYEYIDRHRLIGELVDLTGEDSAVAALSELLDSVMALAPGLPQGAPSATILGDVYLSIADRELARAGIPVVRWADDYRISAAGLVDAYRKDVALERALRSIGLVINSAKTWTPAREVYATWIGRQRARRSSIADVRERIAARREVDYGPTPEDGELGEVEPDPVLEEGFREASDEKAPWGASQEGIPLSQRIRVSLQELGRTGSSLPLERLELLLFRHANLTREISYYLRRRMRAGFVDDTVERVSSVVSNDSFPFEWQLGWLLHSLAPANIPLPKDIIALCRRLLEQEPIPSFIRGRAAVVLATEGALPLGEVLANVYADVSEATRPDLVAAVAWLAETPETRRFLQAARRDALLRQVVELASHPNPYLL